MGQDQSASRPSPTAAPGSPSPASSGSGSPLKGTRAWSDPTKAGRRPKGGRLQSPDQLVASDFGAAPTMTMEEFASRSTPPSPTAVANELTRERAAHATNVAVLRDELELAERWVAEAERWAASARCDASPASSGSGSPLKGTRAWSDPTKAGRRPKGGRLQSPDQLVASDFGAAPTMTMEEFASRSTPPSPTAVANELTRERAAHATNVAVLRDELELAERWVVEAERWAAEFEGRWLRTAKKRDALEVARLRAECAQGGVSQISPTLAPVSNPASPRSWKPVLPMDRGGEAQCARRSAGQPRPTSPATEPKPTPEEPVPFAEPGSPAAEPAIHAATDPAEATSPAVGATAAAGSGPSPDSGHTSGSSSPVTLPAPTASAAQERAASPPAASAQLLPSNVLPSVQQAGPGGRPSSRPGSRGGSGGGGGGGGGELSRHLGRLDAGDIVQEEWAGAGGEDHRLGSRIPAAEGDDGAWGVDQLTFIVNPFTNPVVDSVVSPPPGPDSAGYSAGAESSSDAASGAGSPGGARRRGGFAARFSSGARSRSWSSGLGI